MNISPYKIIRRPIITEKTTKLDENHNQVAFEVDSRASKHDIKLAIESIFKVKVVRVNTMRFRGKPRMVRGRVSAQRPSWKKAVVTLHEGDRIDFYESV